jgi:hypothetical protein
MMTATRARYWRLALPLAVLLLMFCMSAAPPAAAEEPGCGGLDSSERVCAQSGATTPILAVVLDLLPVQTLDLPGIRVSPDGASADPVQHQADLATPRAPPSLT